MRRYDYGMWICLPESFVSVVQDKNQPDRLMVRARRREHLVALLPGHEVVVTTNSDYKYRAFVDRQEFAEIVSRGITELDYSNFKASVRDKDLSRLYHDFWFAHWAIQK
jgi:hypothetical protein